MEPLLKIIDSLRSGFLRSVNAWKGVLISWFVTFLLVCLVAMPLKSALSAGLGDSTVYEQLKNGINVEVLADLRANSGSLGSYFSAGLMMLILVSFVANSFLTGGLFSSLSKSAAGFSVRDFFRAASDRFWSFIIISLIFSLLAVALFLLIVVIPVSLIAMSERVNDVIIFNSAIILSSLFLLVLIILLISSDYSRAWQAAHNNACFKAISFGFRETFRTFFSSYPMMLIIIILQVFYMLVVFKILHGFNPGTGVGIIVLFTASQLLFIIKVLLKVARYGSFTAMMETGVRKDQ